MIDPCSFTDFDGDGTRDISEVMATVDWYDEDNSEYDNNYDSDDDENPSDDYDDNELEDGDDY